MDDKLAEIKQKFGVEEVRLVPGYPGYAVSSCGRVFSWVNKSYIRELKPYKGIQLHLFTEGRRDLVRVGVLVARVFIDKINPKHYLVRHLDDNPANNHVSNLMWGTCVENAEDARLNGKLCKGEKNGFAKINDSIVRDIRSRYKEGVKASILATKYNLDISHVFAIIRCKAWKHVT